jgi:hypothetical protein
MKLGNRHSTGAEFRVVPTVARLAAKFCVPLWLGRRHLLPTLVAVDHDIIVNVQPGRPTNSPDEQSLISGQRGLEHRIDRETRAEGLDGCGRPTVVATSNSFEMLMR